MTFISFGGNLETYTYKYSNGFEYKKTITGRFEIYVGMSLITVIEFVHELQNLNFALLGEDVVFENES